MTRWPKKFPYLESGALFRELQAVTSDVIPIFAEREIEELFTGQLLSARHNFEGPS